MKLWSDSFRDGGSISADNAFAAIDPAHHVRWAANRNPHFAWSEVPAGAESLVLFCIDGDAPLDAGGVNREDATLAATLPRGDFFHWALLDIPLSMKTIAEGSLSDRVTPRGKPGPQVELATGRDSAAAPTAPLVLRQGVNDYSSWFAGDAAMAGDYYGYDGPCPPWNDLRLHHYIFRIYALDLPRLALDGRFNGADVYAAIQGHIIDEAQLIGTYTLNPAVAATRKPAHKKPV
jgi:Raf kinase inhibitor-like YbhB/YbcL family protein